MPKEKKMTSTLTNFGSPLSRANYHEWSERVIQMLSSKFTKIPEMLRTGNKPSFDPGPEPTGRNVPRADTIAWEEKVKIFTKQSVKFEEDCALACGILSNKELYSPEINLALDIKPIWRALIEANNLLDAWQLIRDSFYGNIALNDSKERALVLKAGINWRQGKDCLEQYIRRCTEEVRAIRQIDPTLALDQSDLAVKFWLGLDEEVFARQIADWRMRKELKTTLSEVSQQVYEWYTYQVSNGAISERQVVGTAAVASRKRMRAQRGEAPSKDPCLWCQRNHAGGAQECRSLQKFIEQNSAQHATWISGPQRAFLSERAYEELRKPEAMKSYLTQRERPDYGMEDFEIYGQIQASKEQERYEIDFPSSEEEDDTVTSDAEFK